MSSKDIDHTAVTHLELICDTIVASINENTKLVQFWNTTTLKHLFTLDTAHNYSLNGLKFIVSLNMLVTAHTDGTLQLWNLVKIDKPLNKWKTSEGEINNVTQWSFDLINHDVLVVAVEKSVKFWKLSSNESEKPQLIDHLRTNLNITALSVNDYDCNKSINVKFCCNVFTEKV
jgi:WD40 repeat protein